MALLFAPSDLRDAVRDLVEKCGLDFVRLRSRYFPGIFAPNQRYVNWWLEGMWDFVSEKLRRANNQVAYLAEMQMDEYQDQHVIQRQLNEWRQKVANFQELLSLLSWLNQPPHNIHFYIAVENLG
jgi:hypothetical protein